ncbi:MAG: GntR family transcriptional regulator [Firmicutes bacterium]|nr:GntR family transcriptional regulator [Bacillota bacterium]
MGIENLMAPRPLGSLADQIHDQLERAILEGQLDFGERLVEGQLARLFGTSRSPIREALRRLEAEGLVQIDARRSVSVITLSPEDIVGTFEVREVLEGMAARFAAQRATDEDLALMETYLNRRLDEVADRKTASRIDKDGRDFHDLLIQASHHKQLIEALQSFVKVSRLLKHRAAAIEGRPQEALEEHRAIFEAVRARDAERAEALTRAHVARVKDRLMSIGLKR